MIADHYLDKLDLSADLKDEVSQRIESAAETEDVINVLKAAYGEALERTKVPKDKLVEAIGTALTDFLHPERNRTREAVSNDTAQQSIMLRNRGR